MKPVRRAPLVAIEGIDGAGKTTLQRALANHWRRRGLRVLELQEPSKGPSGRRARQLSGLDPWTAAMGFTEDRRLQRHRIEGALQRGTVVLMDRSYYSTLAYQGSALPPDQRRKLERLQRQVTISPDRVVLLALPVNISETRMHRRGRSREPTEQREVLRRASRTYRRLASRPEWVTLDARTPPEQLIARLDRRLTPWVLRQSGGTRGGT
jgi:dTMP kinase